MSRTGSLAVILTVATAAFFTQLGGARLWDRDEPRNAGCAAEMLERQDWIVPTFNGELRTHKPVLLYWCIISAYQLFGVDEFSARFWSALLGIGTVLATWALGTRLFSPRAGFWAAIVLATTLMFNVAAHAATPDSLLIFCGTMALVTYVHAVDPPQWTGRATNDDPLPAPAFLPLPRGAAAVMYAFMGLGILAKGPVGLVLPTAVLGMFLLIVTRKTGETVISSPPTWGQTFRRILPIVAPGHFLRTCWRMRPITALAIAGLIAGPWYYLVGVHTNGEWLSGFFWEHNVSRALDPMEGHSGSLFYYPVALLIGTFPWSVLTIPVILSTRESWKSGQSVPAVTFLLCWVGVYVAVFSTAQTKLPSYITPTYPAVAVLVGCFLANWQETAPAYAESLKTWRGWPAVSALTLAALGFALLVGLPLAAHHFLPGDELLGMIGLPPLLGGVTVFLLLRRQQTQAAVGALAVSAALFAVGLFGFVAPQVSRHQQIERLLQVANRGERPSPLAAYGSQEPSWVFYAKREIPLFRAEDSDRAMEFLREAPERCLITTRHHFQRLESQLPPNVAILSQIPYFLRNDAILLLGRTPYTAQTEQHATPR